MTISIPTWLLVLLAGSGVVFWIIVVICIAGLFWNKLFNKKEKGILDVELN